MSQKVSGNTRGLKPSELRRIQRLYRRRLDKDEIVSLDFSRELYGAASDLRRRIGVIATREGDIVEICVGTKDILYLPDLGRYRLGRGRLRRLKLIFSDLARDESCAHIPSDIYTDLEKLRFDMVASVRVVPNRVMLAYAYLRPAADKETVHTEQVRDLSRFEFDYSAFMEELEEELAASLEEGFETRRNSAVLVGVYDKRSSEVESSMAELKELARTAGVSVADVIIQRREVDPRTLLGKGKLEEVVLRCLRLGAEMVIFDTELKPAQWRAITNQTELKVLDRSMLILDIFAQRASSSEGRLQVELAQLRYNLPRLVEKDTGLSRLTGGIGGRGPGETKLEIGRRRIRDRISELERRIEAISSQRGLRRKKRREVPTPLVAILGYTNVGKSTLFNALTRSEVLVEDKLFATLDPAQRRLVIGGLGQYGAERLEVVLTDTVGFIRNLPEELKNAFRATLEELYMADLFLHVLDVSDPEILSRKSAVDDLLESLELSAVPTVVVLNKIDRAESDTVERLAREFSAVCVSALERTGFDALKSRVAVTVGQVRAQKEIAADSTDSM